MTSLLRVLLLSCLMTCGAAFASTKTNSVTTTGTGFTESEATAAALAKAVAQVNGTRASTSVSTGKAVIEGHAKKSEDGKTTTADVSISAGTTPDIRMSSSGTVSRYEVLSTVESGGKTTVTLKAYFDHRVAETYKAPGSSVSKTRVAIFPADYDSNSFDFFGPVSGQVLGDSLRDALEMSFIRSSSFSVLDRQTLGASLTELGIVSSKLTNETEKAKLRNLRGADIILLPTVQKASHDVEVKTSQITGQRTDREFTHLLVVIRGIVPATGEVVFAEQYQIEQASSRSDAIAQVAGRSSADLIFKMTGKRISGAGSLAINVAPTRSLDAQYEKPPLPPAEAEGTKLPFDR